MIIHVDDDRLPSTRVAFGGSHSGSSTLRPTAVSAALLSFNLSYKLSIDLPCCLPHQFTPTRAMPAFQSDGSEQTGILREASAALSLLSQALDRCAPHGRGRRSWPEAPFACIQPARVRGAGKPVCALPPSLASQAGHAPTPSLGSATTCACMPALGRQPSCPNSPARPI